MWKKDKNFPERGFSTPPASWSSKPSSSPYSPKMAMSERKRSPFSSDLFHIIHKVPSGHSPYVKAKQVQLIEKDPSKSVSLFWAAINAGDRVDSALKDMAVVMKQLNRPDEAIEAIKSFRHLCPHDTQESIDNILIDLYKRCGRTEEEIELLQSKLKNIKEGTAFNGRRTKIARSQGRKIQVTVQKEKARMLGNLAWAYLQQNKHQVAEEHYREALYLEPDRNKQCNLALCLMHMNRISEAKYLLDKVRASARGKRMDESYEKSYERAFQMLSGLEEEICRQNGEGTRRRQFGLPVSKNSKEGSYTNNNNNGQNYSPFSAGRNLDVLLTQPRNPWAIKSRFPNSMNEEEECSRRNSPMKKKSWADMVQEEEEEEEEEEYLFKNENVNSNIPPQPRNGKNQMEDLDRIKFGLLDLNDKTARRSLCFSNDKASGRNCLPVFQDRMTKQAGP